MTRVVPASVRCRALAAQSVDAITRQGKSLAEEVDGRLAQLDSSEDRALARMLAFGALRFLEPLRFIGSRLAERASTKPAVEALLAVGLFQLRHTRIPDHAAVSETVAATRSLGHGRASGFVNGVLRAYLRQPAAWQAEIFRRPALRYAHPTWIIDALRADWPAHWQRILAANNLQAPMMLRVNRATSNRDAYVDKLNAREITALRHPVAPDGLVLSQPAEVTRLPGFDAGEVSVQDCGAQLAALLMDVTPQTRTLDACVAPGGKLTHLLELGQDPAKTVAIDNDARRLERVRENLRRAGTSTTLLHADAGSRDWWDGQPFDRILVDAPCSASGVIRRHPDIKHLRRQDDLARNQAQQVRILANLWQTLRPGGHLLYATCSVFQQENDAVVAAFLGGVDDAAVARLPLNFGFLTHYGMQTLPGDADVDGFYYSRLDKLAR